MTQTKILIKEKMIKNMKNEIEIKNRIKFLINRLFIIDSLLNNNNKELIVEYNAIIEELWGIIDDYNDSNVNDNKQKKLK